MPVTEIDGTLFDCPQGAGEYLVHQANCVTRRPAHLSWQVFKRFPAADIYAKRRDGHADTPGRLIVVPPVINLLGQRGPGKSRYLDDTPEMRFAWFEDGLRRLATIPNATTFSFPHGIGCGAAGGDWTRYRAAIQAFADAHPQYDVRIYKLPE